MKNILSKYAMVIAALCFCQALEAQEISSFTLINAQEDIEIGILSDGDSIYIPDYNTKEFSVRADVSARVGSILFELDGEVVGADNRPAYALLGNPGNDYASWIPELRTYTITGSAYSLPQGGGTLLDTYSTTVTFVDDVVVETAGPIIQSLVLVNADSDEDIAEIIEGSVFVLEEIGTANLNIRAETDSSTQSVVFDYQGVANYHIDNLPEYAIGANDDADYRPWIPDLGVNTVTATAFVEEQGAGTSGNPITVNFEIMEKAADSIPPFVLRINSGGGPVVLNDSISYIADTLFVGSSKSYSNKKITDILETTQDSIYKTERTSSSGLKSFGYAIPVNDGDYEIKLHFAEIYWGATGGGSGGEGKRLFSVSIEDKEVIADYDMNAEKDPMTAIVKTFSATVADGELNIDLGASVNQPKISAIEIIGKGSLISTNTCSWEDLADSSLNKLGRQGVRVNDKLYVLGGMLSDSTKTPVTEIYDPVTNSWSLAAPMPLEVSHMGAVGVEDEIWIIAGFTADSLAIATDKVQIYNTITDTWSIGPSLPSTRGAGAATFNEGKIHFLGGQSQDSVIDSGDHYILDVNNIIAGWELAAPLPNPRSHLGTAALNGKIYVMGGQNVQDSVIIEQRFLDEYDPVTDSWTRKADLPSARSHFGNGTMVHGNKIIIVGGKSDDAIAEYDLITDSWAELCNLPSKFLVSSAGVFGDRLIAVGEMGEGALYPMSSTISISLEPVIEIPEERELSVLVFHETGGYRHRSIEAGIDMITEFGNDLGWRVNASQTSDIFQSDSLAIYDVVIWLNTTGEDLLTDSEELAFEGFIKNGGGFVGVHSATDTYRNGSWPWYNDLVGAIVQVSPYHTANNTNATIDIVGEHSAVAHLGSEWNKNDEYYYWERNGGYLFDGNIDLLTVRSTGPNSYDAARPVTWYKEYDGGRSFYTALGHNAADYESNDKFRTMLREAIIWAAEEDKPLVDEAEPVATVTPTENNTIVLFPNPVINQLFIATESLSAGSTGEILIFGMDGSLRKQKNIDSNENQIDMTDLPTGYYAVALKIGTVSERHLIYKN